MAEFDNKTCTKLEVEENGAKRLLFVKSEWNARCFELAASDGLQAWRFDGSEAFVTSRAEAWDKKPSWVMEKLKFYLKLGQAGVTYRFTKTRDINQRKLSFDIEDKESDLALTANLVMVNASDPESVTCDLLGFLYDSNCRLSESYVKKCDSLTKLLRESVALVDLNTRLKNAKVEFETDANKKARELKKENERLKKEIEKLREDSKSKAGEEDERDDTTSSSSSEDEDDEEKEKESSDHERSTPVERDEAVRERFVSEEIPVMEPGSSSGVNADPDATQPFLDEVEDIDAPVVEPPKEKETPSEMPGDEPYKGIQRKKRRQL